MRENSFAPITQKDKGGKGEIRNEGKIQDAVIPCVSWIWTHFTWF